MSQPGCLESMELLNFIFSSGIIFNDGHEILARLNAGDRLADAVEEVAVKFGRNEDAKLGQAVSRNWPALHVEAVSELVRWALGKLDTEDRIMVEWRGDPEYHETVTRFELRGHTLVIEFAHPPGVLTA